MISKISGGAVMPRRRTTLPIEEYEVLEKDLSRLARRTGPRGRFAPVLSGLHLPDREEIWIHRDLPEPEKSFTLLHELVHARRSLSEEECTDPEVEELLTELEAIARAPDATLGNLFMGRLLLAMKGHLTEEGRLDPDTPQGLGRILNRAGALVTTLLGRPPSPPS